MRDQPLISDQNNRDKTAYQIREKITSLKRDRQIGIKLKWVNAHIGTEGNKIADRIAKEATIISPSSNKYPSKNAVKRNIKKQIIDQWQTNWNETQTGRFTHSIIPQVTTKIAFSDVTKLSARKNHLRAASGHFPRQTLKSAITVAIIKNQ